MVKKVQKILNISQRSLLSMVLLLVPLFFNFVYITNNVYDVNKAVIFKELIFASLVIIFLGVIFLGRLPLLKSKETIIAGLWLIFVILGTTLSQNIAMSFFGSYEREQGFITQIFYLVFFLLLLVTIEAKKIDKYILIGVIASFFVSVYGLLQISGYDFITSGGIVDRSSSTIGQPNFLGQYLLLTIWFPIYLFARTKNFYLRSFYIIVFLTDLSALFLTYSRASWAGFMVGALSVISLFLIIEKPWKAIKKNLLKIILSFALLLMVFSVLVYNDENFAFRLNNAFDYKKSSLSIRFTFWENSLDMIKQKPIFGYGLENLANKFSDHYRKDWAILGYVNQYPDRAHNLILDAILTNGLIGFIVFVCFFLFIFYVVLKNIRQDRNKWLNYISLVSLLSYLASLLLSFQSITDGVYFWFILALIVVSSRQEGKEEIIIYDLEKVNVKFKYPAKSIAGVAIIALIFLARIEFKKLLADFYVNEFQVASSQGDINAAINIYDLVKQNSSYRQRNYDNMMIYFFTTMLNENIDANNKDRIIEILRNMEISPRKDSYENEKTKFLVYSSLAVYPRPDNEYKQKAENTLKELVENKSEMPAVYRLGARHYCNIGDLARSVKYSEKALSLLPDLNTVETNMDHANNINTAYYFIHREMGDCYFKNKQYEKAGENYLSAYLHFPGDINILKRTADTFVARQQYDRAIVYLSWGERRDHTDHAWPFAIAQVYAMKNEKVKAIEYAQRALLLSPENNDLQKFIVQIK